MLDPQLHFLRPGMSSLPNSLLKLEWPAQKRARRFTVRCPHCGQTYLSRTLRRFGFVTYDNYVYAVAAVCVAVVALILIGTPRG